jgi:heme/copper-type cytochrome/quinol oxidase subunit 2
MSLNASDLNIVKVSADQLLNNALNTVYLVGGILAVIVIIVAGYFYVTSSGNATTVEKAKNAILYAVIGLVIILLAFAITWFVIGRFNN